jgi:hypothetical protein
MYRSSFVRAPVQTTPPPIFGASYEISSQCIALNIPHYSQQMMVLLNDEQLVAALPDTPTRTVFLVIVPSVGSE